MILASLSDSSRYEALHPLFKKAFDYIREHDFADVEPGRIELEGSSLFINVCDVQMKRPEEQKLEVHRKYIDIHVPISGEETIGWKHLSALGNSEAPFDEEGDFALYAEPASALISVKPGEFLAVYPEDAHAPIIGEGTRRKLIVKVLL